MICTLSQLTHTGPKGETGGTVTNRKVMFVWLLVSASRHNNNKAIRVQKSWVTHYFFIFCFQWSWLSSNSLCAFVQSFSRLTDSHSKFLFGHWLLCTLITQSLQLPVKCRPMFFVTFFVLSPLTLTYESIEHKKGHLMPGLDFCRESLTLYFDFISLFVSNRKVAQCSA